MNAVTHCVLFGSCAIIKHFFSLKNNLLSFISNKFDKGFLFYGAHVAKCA